MFVQRYQKSMLKKMTGSYLSNSLKNCNTSILKYFISTNSVNYKKYYEALGVSPSATQSDIKTAYYKLSKVYHPDLNKGSEKAAQKFRDITAAYEVLGNYRTRKLYDKGIIHNSNSQYADSEESYHEELKEDDAQTKFYKAHMKKSQVPHFEGRTPIYNFDEWSRLHYGKSFERRRAAKERYDKKEAQKTRNVLEIKSEFLLICFVICVIAFSTVIVGERSLDTNKIMTKNKKDFDES